MLIDKICSRDKLCIKLGIKQKQNLQMGTTGYQCFIYYNDVRLYMHLKSVNSNVCSVRKTTEKEREKRGNDINVRQFYPLFHPIKLCLRVKGDISWLFLQMILPFFKMPVLVVTIFCITWIINASLLLNLLLHLKYCANTIGHIVFAGHIMSSMLVSIMVRFFNGNFTIQDFKSCVI